jgi:hypothetical protein
MGKKKYEDFEHIKEVDKSYIPNTDNMSFEEKIEYIKSLLEFVEDKTELYKMLETLKNQNKDE